MNILLRINTEFSSFTFPVFFGLLVKRNQPRTVVVCEHSTEADGA